MILTSFILFDELVKSKLRISLFQTVNYHFRFYCFKNTDFMKQSHLVVDIMTKPFPA